MSIEDRTTLLGEPHAVPAPVTCSLRLLFLYNVAEAIRLESLHVVPGVNVSGRAPSFAHPAPEYLRFERAPLIEQIEPSTIGTLRIDRRAKYYEYGIITIELIIRVESTWQALVRRVSEWVDNDQIEALATEALSRALSHAKPALIKPYLTHLSEDYYVVELHSAGNGPIEASDLLRSHGREIAQLVRGDDVELSSEERQDVLQSSVSYSTRDLSVVGWTGALVYDTPEGAAAVVELLEYANTELLELRYYDSVLTRLLEQVYAALEHKKGIFSPWHLSQEAARLGTLRLDIMELTEKADNALKFVGDMFYARLHRLAAMKIGVPDYRSLVDQKLRTAGELYKFMVDHFEQSRSFVLELAVVIILLIDLWFLLRGA